jgi:hypothetical protein
VDPTEAGRGLVELPTVDVEDRVAEVVFADEGFVEEGVRPSAHVEHARARMGDGPAAHDGVDGKEPGGRALVGDQAQVRRA